MFTIIAIRNDFAGNEIYIPIMQCDGDGDPTEIMATWHTLIDAEDFCQENILCKTSINIITDLHTGHQNNQ